MFNFVCNSRSYAQIFCLLFLYWGWSMKKSKKNKDAIFGSKEIVGWKQIVQKLWVPKILCSKNEFGAKINLIPKGFLPKRILDKKKIRPNRYKVEILWTKRKFHVLCSQRNKCCLVREKCLVSIYLCMDMDINITMHSNVIIMYT